MHHLNFTKATVVQIIKVSEIISCLGFWSSVRVLGGGGGGRKPQPAVTTVPPRCSGPAVRGRMDYQALDCKYLGCVPIQEAYCIILILHTVLSPFSSARGLDGQSHWLQPHLPALVRIGSPPYTRINVSRPQHATMRLRPWNV